MVINTYTLNRVSKTAKQTEGFILVGEQQFHTLELPDLGNTPFISCIPVGCYLVKMDKTGKHQYYRLQGVPGRSSIEMHPVSDVRFLEGCIALGLGFTESGSLVSSQEACELFLSLIGDNDFYLDIKEL